MIVTPPDFTPVLAPVEDATPKSFVFFGEAILLREDGGLPDAGACAALAIAPDEFIPVGILGSRYCRAALRPAYTPVPAGHALAGLRSLFGVADDALLAVAGRARQLVQWMQTHRYCGACGTPTQAMPGERARKCPACGQSDYPRISPAMMVLVKRGPEILLARHRRFAARYSALAGFLEAGESIEDAVHREVREEVGLAVKDLRYFASQSWPFPHSLMIAFTAEWAGGEIRVDEDEIAEARWFGPGDALPELPIAQSVARALIEANLPRKASAP